MADEVGRVEGLQLLDGPEAPRHAAGLDAGVEGRAHVDARVAHVERLLPRDAGLAEDVLDDARVRLRRHPLPLPKHGHEGHAGEEPRDQLARGRLVLVRGDGQPRAPLVEPPEQFGNALVGAAEIGVMPVIIRNKELADTGHFLRRPPLGWEGPLEQLVDAVAHEIAVGRDVVGGVAEGREGLVGGAGQVVDRVEQRPVQVENN